MILFNITKRKIKLLLVIFIILHFAYLVWLRHISEFLSNINNQTPLKEAQKLSKNTKYILLWTPQEIPRINGVKSKQYLKKYCSVKNCHVTTDKTFLSSLTMYHAIVFDAPSLTGGNFYSSDFPATRSWNQKYIFYSDEPSVDVPLCSEIFSGFFNWTVTFKLKSDFPIPFISIRNLKGEVVGPAKHLIWKENLEPVNATLASQLKYKTLSTVWFESCPMANIKQERYLKRLQKQLDYYQYRVYVFGKHKRFWRCSRRRHEIWLDLIKKNYYFFLAFEDAMEEDYVTENILIALNNNAIPVVYGGANYTRFLPPNSYLDTRAFSPAEMATKMYYLMMSPHIYKEYFRWKNYYTYHEPPADTLCNLCLALNNKTMYGTSSVYTDFRKWWNSNYENNCY